MKKVAFYTLGCKVNQYETEAMVEAFKTKGYNIVDYNGFSDIYIINTCTVTNMGDRKSRQIIKRALEFNKEAFIAVVGCYSQIAPREVLNMEGVKLVVGTNKRSEIVEFVEEALNKKEEKINKVSNIMDICEFEDMPINQYENKTRAFVKIQEGCDCYCSYCIIPYARGHIRSRDSDSVLEEVRKLADNGFVEIVLTGIHVGSYGVDLKNIKLIDLIENIAEVDGIERIRISSVEPNTLDDSFIFRISKLKKICRHFHLSLQSGCDETLRRMNRKYTTNEYRKVVNNLRYTFGDVGITTDIIVGFPGETDEEFNKTFEFIKEMSFSSMHVFKYSPRKGTPAAGFINQVSGDIKNERSNEVRQLAMKSQEEFIKKFIDRPLKVLFEQEVKGKKGFYEGLTDNYIRVYAKSDDNINGKLLDTLITEPGEDHAIGKLL